MIGLVELIQNKLLLLPIVASDHVVFALSHIELNLILYRDRPLILWAR